MFNTEGHEHLGKPRVEGWTKKVTPERYLKMWPNGPEAKLALQLTTGLVEGLPPTNSDKVRFFSPNARGLTIVVDSKKWIKSQTPGGEMTLQTEGITVNFENGCFETDNPQIIEYLTLTYKDRRYPVVRTDKETASAVS